GRRAKFLQAALLPLNRREHRVAAGFQGHDGGQRNFPDGVPVHGYGARGDAHLLQRADQIEARHSRQPAVAVTQGGGVEPVTAQSRSDGHAEHRAANVEAAAVFPGGGRSRILLHRVTSVSVVPMASIAGTVVEPAFGGLYPSMLTGSSSTSSLPASTGT